MAAPRTVNDILDELRSLLDESNEVSLDDTRDLLPALNRAQSYAYNILSRNYEEPLLTNTVLTLSGSAQEYPIPEDAFEDRVEKVEIYLNGSYAECKRISYRDVSDYEQSDRADAPSYYCVIGRNIRFVPAPSGTYNARVWYLRDPERMVAAQGRITLVNSGSNYVLLDETGTSLTTEDDSLNSYVNLIDGQTGEVKCTLQVQNINGQKITFKTVPSRTTVLNRTVTGGLSALPVDVVIEPDDYICTVHGTCVLYFQDALLNFILQYAAFQMQQKLGVAQGQDAALVKEFEKQVERQWTGREQSLRVKRASSLWTPAYRKRFNRW